MFVNTLGNIFNQKKGLPRPWPMYYTYLVSINVKRWRNTQMDFTGRNSQPAQPAASGAQFAGPNTNAKRDKSGNKASWFRWAGGGLGLLLTALVVAAICAVAFNDSNTEAKLVNKDKHQAIFLNTGQVYFGKVTDLNNKYITLTKIYYLQTSSTGTTTANQQANTSVSLVKLGCELHEPYDQMVINRSQVTFWENLQDNGQVAKAIAEFVKKNPEGQKCADQSAAPNSNSNVQGSTNSTTNNTTKTTNP